MSDIRNHTTPPKRSKKTGYDPVDLLMAPIEPPRPQPADAPDRGQTIRIAIGALLIIIGLFGWLLTGATIFLFAVVAGTVCIVAGTLIKTHPKR